APAPPPAPTAAPAAGRGSPRVMALQAEFDVLIQKYGNNPYIIKDSERVGSKRVVTKKIRAAVDRNKKRSEKQRTRTEVQMQLAPEDAKK
ncbi:MAG: hypothetical protein O9327_17215, partial [Polaromonas sp.]|nr:hypothetical protein [Polaromonas sp.]